MVPYLSKRPLLRKLIQAARAPLVGRHREPFPIDPPFQPRVRRLEPRLVLNATAELNAIGQLFVMGSSSSETVQLGVDASGDLLLRNETGAIIPIENHPDGPGFETNPLDPSAITSGEIRFEMGESADLLNLELPSGLDVSVIGGGGDDVTVLRFADDRAPGTIAIDTELIEIDPGSTSVRANGAVLNLSGDVTFGQQGQASELALSSGTLTVAGQLIVSGDVLMSGTGATIDLSAANLVTNFDQTTLTIDLQNQVDGDVTFGGTDDSAGTFLQQIDVLSASSVSFVNAPMFVAGDLSVVDADSVRVDVDIDTTVGSQDGNVALHSSTDLSVTSDSLVSVGDATITLSSNGGTINLVDGSLISGNTGNAITILSADNVMLGDVTAISGNLTLGVSGGEVGNIGQGPDTALNVDRLEIDSFGSVNLSNSHNQLALIERIDVDGNLSITDSVGDLAIVDIDSRGRQVSLITSGSMFVGRVKAVAADVRLTASGINDATDDTVVDITASRLFVDATTGIGDLRPLELSSVSELTATSDRGDIVLDSKSGAPIELRSVIAHDGAIEISAVRTMIATEVSSLNASSLIDGSRDITLTTRGNILVGRIEAADADVRLTGRGINDATDDAVADIISSRLFIDATTGIGNLRPLELSSVSELTATSNRGDIVLDSQSGGPIELRSVIARDGAIGINSAGTMIATEVASLNAPGLVDGSRDITLTATGDILAGRIEAVDADVHLTGRGINDATDDAVADLISSRLFIDATTGIGNLRPLELSSVSELTATSVSGDIAIDSQSGGPIELRSVIAGDGAIGISSAGTMIATEVSSLNASGLDDGSRNIMLTATDARSDILVTRITAAGDADVSLNAGDDILDDDLNDDNAIVADDLALVAGNQTDDSNRAIDLTTTINDLQAVITGVNRGDLFLQQNGSITLASSDAQGDEIIQTSNGQIVIAASGDITITDTSTGDDGDDWKLDPEVVAGGVMGRIDLASLGQIELQDDVQLHSEKVTTQFANPESVTNPVDPELQRSDRSVFLTSDTIVFGERIEINTGVDQGIARFFAPRPIVEIDRSDPDNPKPAAPADPNVVPAFFDPFTVDTSVLEQAAVNDATGILTLDIGREGERGLTVDIDWGAPSTGSDIGQFQQLNGLSADDSTVVGIDSTGKPIDPITTPNGSGRLDVEHYYTQDAILDSRENGRNAATDPLEVRFSVRHHDSIFIQANKVSQAPDFEALPVPGSVVTSTDNPTTPPNTPNGLENGQASFIIPSLTIPVAFFPVRDVIPTLETPEFTVRTDVVAPFAQDAFETVETTVSSSVAREEYFQIRVLSPDPQGGDLIEPSRLPDDIMEGDKIQQLFQRLPDGQYEIEYVLGDGNERSILRVDVRDGEATVPSEPLDAEGELELESVDEQASDDRSQDDSTMLDFDSKTKIVSGFVFATTLKRQYRNRKRRLSMSGRFASRRRILTSTEQEV